MSNRDYLDVRNEEIRKFRRDGLTLASIGKKYGVTREAIRLICRGIPKPDLKTYHTKKCENCSKEFTVVAKKKEKKTCSKECFAKIQRFNNYKNGEWTKDLVDLECAGCGKEFKKTKKIIGIAKHSYKARGMDFSAKQWYCSRGCNLLSIRERRKKKVSE